MANRDPLSLWTELKEAGASPQAVYAEAKSQGLDRLETIRVLRSLFGLTLAEAKAVMAPVRDPANAETAHLETREQLLRVLSSELGYCDCASGDALKALVQFLRAARRRSDCENDPAEFASASLQVKACLPLEAAPGLAEWFVYGLEQRGLVSHNFRVTDVWITSKGRWLLEAMERTQLVEG